MLNKQTQNNFSKITFDRILQRRQSQIQVALRIIRDALRLLGLHLSHSLILQHDPLDRVRLLLVHRQPLHQLRRVLRLALQLRLQRRQLNLHAIDHLIQRYAIAISNRKKTIIITITITNSNSNYNKT